jgi:hypothetical protein
MDIQAIELQRTKGENIALGIHRERDQTKIKKLENQVQSLTNKLT